MPELVTVWFVPDRHYYIAGVGIFEKTALSDESWGNHPLDITNFEISEIRGTGLNDVFAVGSYGEILHFNGVNWKSYQGETGQFYGNYGCISIKNNLVVSVGYENQQAKILIGQRINPD